MLVTGGAGFIGSSFLRLMVSRYPDVHFVNLDVLTYAANPANLSDLETVPNYEFLRADIADRARIRQVFAEFEPQVVVHFAAESHVDRSILGPDAFVQTNVVGTFSLLEAFRAQSRDRQVLFHHVSTDEVYGSLGSDGYFTERSPYLPSNPYSASKAASNHLVSAYYRTFGIPATITNGSNTYGPYQFPEKVIPLMTLNARDGERLPLYGEGVNVRDWIHVSDHCEAIWAVMERGRAGETYNVGGGNETRNLDLVRRICTLVAEWSGRSEQETLDLITFVRDRPGHDLRYAVDSTKLARDCGWTPRQPFEAGLRETVRWYMDNSAWVEGVRSGGHLKVIEQMYGMPAKGTRS
jgi:dTDP-glucose 4,6-dehydratase